MPDLINDKTAVVGIGQTPFGKGLADTELSLACQAIAMALEDAGIAPAEVDGLTSFTMEPNREVDVARAVGLGDITFFARSGSEAVRGAVSSGTPRWPWRPDSARSRSRGGPASAPTRRAGRGPRPKRASPTTGSGPDRSGSSARSTRSRC